MFPLSTLLFSMTAATSSVYGLENINNIVTFGDSWTDSGRKKYISDHGGDRPPAGTIPPEIKVTSSGGLAWSQIAARSEELKLFNYAVGGGTLSYDIVERYGAEVKGSYPSVVDYQVPAFAEDLKTGGDFDNITSDNTIYTLWIGTNDLGPEGFLLDNQKSDKTLGDFVRAMWDALDQIYEAGGRHFVLFNEVPLETVPMFRSEDNGGAGDNAYWRDKSQHNSTEVQDKAQRSSRHVNRLVSFGVPHELLVNKRWPDAAITIFDVHALLSDVFESPEDYLEKPAHTLGAFKGCKKEDGKCPDPFESYMWNDVLHLSERTAEIVAKHFVRALTGESQYAIRYTS